MQCPECKSENVTVQREQTANIGAGTNKIVIQEPKRSRGSLYWLFIGWWKTLLFGGRKKSGLNFHANKNINKTIAICQNCGHTWKV